MKRECEMCGRMRVVNRYQLCATCWQAQDHSHHNDLYELFPGIEEEINLYTASHTLADIIPYAAKELATDKERK